MPPILSSFFLFPPLSFKLEVFTGFIGFAMPLLLVLLSVVKRVDSKQEGSFLCDLGRSNG